MNTLHLALGYLLTGVFITLSYLLIGLLFSIQQELVELLPDESRWDPKRMALVTALWPALLPLYVLLLLFPIVRKRKASR